VTLFDALTGQEERRFAVHSTHAYRVTFRPDGKAPVVTGGGDFVDLAENRVTGLFEHAGVILPDWSYYAGGLYKSTLRLFELPSGRVVTELAAGGDIHTIAATGLIRERDSDTRRPQRRIDRRCRDRARSFSE
jgi:hypothetical protein